MSIYKNLIKTLIKKNINVSIAESCTGGKLSEKFTEIPGSSKFFHVGLVTYSNEAKHKFLKISKSIIIKYGAVSKEIAILMSNNLFKLTNSNLCISVTGIAGPAGATKSKPVGLIFISIRYNGRNHIFKKLFKGSRKQIQNEIIKFCFKEIKKLI